MMQEGQGDIGYICAGQLAGMGCEAAIQRGLHPVVLGTSNTASAAQVILEKGGTSVVSEDGNSMAEKYMNIRRLDEFVLALKPGAPVAFDWENAPAEALQYLQSRGLILKPGLEVLKTTQHRGREKAKINQIHGSTVTAEYYEVSSFEEAQQAFENLGNGRLKTCEGGYDGKGQWTINSEDDLVQAFDGMGENVPELVFEKNVDFEKETSVIVGRNAEGQFAWYDPFVNHHEDGILRTTKAGFTGIDREIRQTMIEFTKKIAEGLDLEGIMALEMFLERDGTFKANEIAARTHNSGHITRSTHAISQFDLQIMAMLNEDLPGYIKLQRPGTMINIIGDDTKNRKHIDWSKFETTNVLYPRSSITSYGKGEPRPGRKMGHTEVAS